MNAAARLRGRWYLVILAIIVSLAVAATTQLKISSGGVSRDRQVYHVAHGEVLIDSNPSSITNINTNSTSLSGRAQLISQYATGSTVIDSIATLAKVKPSALTVQSTVSKANKNGNTVSDNTLSGSGRDSVMLSAARGQTIEISTQAGSTAVARRLVPATITALTRTITRLQNAQPLNHPVKPATPPLSAAAKARNPGRAKRVAAAIQQAITQQQQRISKSKIIVRRFGTVNAETVTAVPRKAKTIGYFIVTLVILLVLILVLDNLFGAGRRTAQTVAVTRPRN